MTIRTNNELARVLKGQRGARFCLCDFHVHSPASHDVSIRSDLNDIEKSHLSAFLGAAPKDFAKHQQEILSAFSPSEYLSCLVNRRDEVVTTLGVGEYNRWAILAITDHNICTYAAQLAHAAWEDRKKTS